MPQHYRSIDPAQADAHPRAGAPANSQFYYSYHDAEGTHIVDSMSLVPHNATHVRRITLSTPPDPPPKTDVNNGSISDRALQMFVPHVSPDSDVPALGENTKAPIPVLTVPSPHELVRDVPHLSNATVILGALACFSLGMLMRPLRPMVMRFGMSVVGLTLLGSVYVQWLSRRLANAGISTPAIMDASHPNPGSHERMADDNK